MIKAPIDSFTGESLVDYCLRRDTSLQRHRSNYLTHWQDISKVFMPRGTRFDVSEVGQGNKRNRDLINGTPVYTLNVLASGMMSGITSPSRPWAVLRTDPVLGRRRDVRMWLDQVRNILFETFLKSNLYTTLPLVYMDLGAFGTSSFAVVEDEEDVIRCQHFPIGSYTLSTSYRGNVDAVFRQMSMTVHQIVSKFGKENVSSTVMDAFQRKQFDTYYDVMHVCEPNPSADARRLESRYLPYRSIYFEKSNHEDHLLSLRGFNEQTVLSPRWRVVGEDTYGISPAMDALGDAQQLQKMEKRGLQILDMILQPPRAIPASLRDEYAGTLAGEFLFINRNDEAEAVKPNYVPNPNMDHLYQGIARVEDRIRRHMHEDLFRMLIDLERSNVTATEIQAKQQEKMTVLGPVLERMNDEMLDPLVIRTLGILERRGELPPPPPDLEGKPLVIEYVSLMAQSMKLQGLTAVERFVGFVGSIGAVRQDALDKLNVDETIDGFGDMAGVPPQMINDAEIVDAIRKSRAQDAAQQQMMAMASEAASAAKTMSETQVSTPSMLSNMAGLTQGGF